MKNYRMTLIVVILAFLSSRAFSQSHAGEILELTTNKLRVINQNLRVVEQTFADIIPANDTTLTNRLYTHTLYSSNTYHINGFASSEDISDINISVYKFDSNGNIQLIARDNQTGNDVSFVFRPIKSDAYYFAVTATLRTNVQSSFFNLIIDRE